MNQWSRQVSFESNETQAEKWIYNSNQSSKEFEVITQFGKPVDILSLKLNMLEDFGGKVQLISDSRKSLYQKDNVEQVDQCPVCAHSTDDYPVIVNIYGANYVQCPQCTHYFVAERPSKESIENFYATDTLYQSTYSDPRILKTRIEQVATPKVKWVVEQFERKFNKKPKRLLDVGAGSGHIVYAAQQLGLEAQGVELSESGRLFAKDNFDIDLINCDFIEETQRFSDFDIITFWGVIEHVPYPVKMLNAANEVLKGRDALVVAEVPRWDCFSTAIQTKFKESIVRHLDPLGHINCFTDSSFSTAFVNSHFDIVSAWYLGMDAYELITQISYHLKDENIIKELGPSIPDFQRSFDLARLSDCIVLAGRPA